MRDHAARILEQAYDPRNGPVGEDVSPRLDPTGMYDAWPLLCKGPFLLPTNEEAAILQGQPGRRMQGAVHERAEDLFAELLLSPVGASGVVGANVSAVEVQLALPRISWNATRL